MDNIQEIEKLHALKEKGVLSQEEFEAQKTQLLSGGSRPKPGSAKRWWKIPLALVGFAVGITFFYGAISTLNGTAGSAAGTTCDSDAAKDTLKHAFDLSQFARTLNLSAIEVSNPIEQTHDAKTGARSCKGDISMNNASVAHVTYKIEPRPNGQFMLTFEVDESSAVPAESSSKPEEKESSGVPAPDAVTPVQDNTQVAPQPSADNMTQARADADNVITAALTAIGENLKEPYIHGMANRFSEEYAVQSKACKTMECLDQIVRSTADQIHQLSN